MLEALGHSEIRLLIVDPCNECEDILPTLGRVGWTIESSKLADARERRCDVGLIRLQLSHREHPESVKQLIHASGTEWVAVVDHDLMRTAGGRELIGQWFFDFHTLPFDPERMRVALGRALGMARIRRYCSTHEATEDSDLMVGDSPDIRTLRSLLAKLAPTTSPVLIQAESGTGKELVAHTLHRLSTRSKGPFIAINCGAVATSLIQSELFGHEKGAFTGAHQRKIGRIEAANGGTLFLDEIGDLPLKMQTNLLRFMQEMTIERVGGHSPITVNVRVVEENLQATHLKVKGYTNHLEKLCGNACFESGATARHR